MLTLTPKKGRLLIAEPSILNDFSFKRSIILLTEHSSHNSVGFILNRPTQYVLDDLIANVNCDFPVYKGGPVEQENLYFIHRIPHLLPGSLELSKGLFWGGNFEELHGLLQKEIVNPNDIRFFLGYSGWGSNQLSSELKTKSWFIVENQYENILSVKEDNIWKNQLLKKGGEYALWANAPSDIQMN